MEGGGGGERRSHEHGQARMSFLHFDGFLLNSTLNLDFFEVLPLFSFYYRHLLF
jgi:hypothetical protein